MRDLEKTVRCRGRKFLLRVETSHVPADYQKYEDIRNAIWGFPDDHLAGTRNMMCENFLAEGGSLFIGAFAEAGSGEFLIAADHLVGFCYGFVGTVDKEIGFRDPSNFRFYSQFAAVRREFQHFGLGILIKEFQREIILDLYGITTVICTYDPLTGVNAQRNVHHFGMEVQEYRVATYGEYGGFLNRADVPTDRFLMAWDLKKPERRETAASRFPSDAGAPVFRVETRRVKGKTSALNLEVVQAADLDASQEMLLVEIPLDFYVMLRETDVEDQGVRRIPVDWRLQTRRAFQTLFGRGYRVVDFEKAEGRGGRNRYILMKSG
jgi:predicted GNAT superfamily acetyltransferase